MSHINNIILNRKTINLILTIFMTAIHLILECLQQLPSLFQIEIANNNPIQRSILPKRINLFSNCIIFISL